jgi:lysophospholipase L1-like esterase
LQGGGLISVQEFFCGLKPGQWEVMTATAISGSFQSKNQFVQVQKLPYIYSRGFVILTDGRILISGISTMFGTLRIVVAASMVFMCPFVSRSQVPFESEIQEFERIDARDGYFPASVLFVGSSSIRMWGTLAADMNPLPVLNRGFGGASLSHVTYYADRIILPHKPRMIVLYAGENDLAYETGTIGNLVSYFNAWSNYLKSKLPGTQLYFISIKPSIARWQYWEKMKEANRQIREIIDREPDYHYIDVAGAMLTSSGYVRDDIFLSDNLHMNAKGYAIWTSIIKPKLTEEYARVFGTENRPPSDLAISNRRISENEAAGAEIGAFSTTDPDAGDVHRYALVSGSGDSGNSKFTLESGGLLRSAVPFDFEQQNSYSIRVRTTDKAGTSLDRNFAIEILNANDAPRITSLKILPDRPRDNENLMLSYTFFDEDAGDSESGTQISWFRNGIQAGEWSGARTIPSSSLAAGQRWYAIVRPGDGKVHGMEYASAVVEIVLSNRPPADIVLSGTGVDENQPAGTEVGRFATFDQNSGDAHSYALVPGVGDSGNGAFSIDHQGSLHTAGSFDYEQRNVYPIRVRSTDMAGASMDKEFVIAVLDINEAPWITDLVILPDQPKDNEELLLQYTFSDPDAGNTEKGTEIRWFRNGTEVTGLFGARTVPPSRIGEGEFWKVLVKPGDGALFGPEIMSAAVEILTSNVPPADIELSKNRITENKPAGTRVGILKAVDANEDDLHTFSLVAGPGDEANHPFRIENGNELVSAIKFDFEVQNHYSVRLAAADRKGERIEKAFAISIDDADDPPVATQSRMNLSFNEDDPPAYIDLSGLFYDQDGDSIAIAISGNSNDSLLSAMMETSTLVLFLMPDAYGDVLLNIKAVARGKSAKSGVMIQVAPVDDPPRPVAGIARLIIREDEPPVDVDLDGWFTDVDDPDEAIAYRIVGVSDPDLLTATLQANILTVAPVSRHWGEGTIALEAVSGFLSTTFELPVTVDRITGLGERRPAPVSLYPNPAAGIAWLDPMPDFSGPLFVDIYNALGIRVFSSEASGVPGNRIPLELNALPDGAYTVQVAGQDISAVLRLIIRK